MSKEDFILDFIEKPEQYFLDDDIRINIGSNPSIKLEDVVFYRIDRITYEDKAPRKEALENVLSAMRIKGVNFHYLIKGDKTGVSFYYGISRDLIQKIDIPYSIDQFGDFILKPGLESNFRGSKITKLEPLEEQDIINSLSRMKHVGNLDGVPGINGDNDNYQGVDRMVDVMLGDEFALLVTAKALSPNSIRNFEKNIYNFYDRLIPISKKNVQTGENTGETDIDTISKGTSSSDSDANQTGKTINHGISHQESRTSTKQVGNSEETRAEATSTTNNEGVYSDNSGITKTHTNGFTENRTTGTNKTTGSTKNTSYEFTNKEAQEWLKYIDEVILKRLDYGKGKGMFISTISLFSMEESTMVKLENTTTALFSGESGNKIPLRKIALKVNGQRQVVLKNFQIPIANFIHNISENEVYTRTVLSQYVTKERAYLGNWFSVNELSIIAGLPQKEIVGLSLRPEVEFGLNYSQTSSENKIQMGKLVQSGNILNIDVELDRKELNKHIFVAGVTGSGKTTTCQKLLINSELPFLVIEPAKTEYRILTKQYDDIIIFTLGKDKIAPFRLNPFEFYPHETITSHVDMIMASIEASFDMEAAIPQIIEKAIYECYIDYGWNIENDSNKYYTEDDILNGAYSFPTLSDLIRKTEDVVETQGFDIRLQNDYIGSIKARLQGLTVGSKGLMLNTSRSVDFRELVHKRVILELEEIRSGNEKSLIMGFILSNLTEAIKAEFYRDTNFKHITLVEEAHRLLAKYEPGDSLSKKQGIEMFADMLAEVRKYGESLVIVDQIPGKLTPEVLKNTNTKIVHKIFARDDKETIGNTMALTDEQKDFLSFLDIGRAIIFSHGWDSSLQVQIIPETDTGNKEIINEALIRNNAIKYYCHNYKSGIFQSIKYFDKIPTREDFEYYISIKDDLNELVELYNELLRIYNINEKFISLIKKLELTMSIEMQAKYIRDAIYYPNGNDEKLNAICSLLLEIKNNKCNLAKYNEKLSYGRRRK